MQLRPYQTEAVDAVIQSFRERKRPLVELPTGSGKTVVFAELTRRLKSGRALVLVHRKELKVQAEEKIRAANPGCEVDVRMVQTVSRRLHIDYKAAAYSLIIIDECFVAGTLVHERAIETYRPGSMVTAYDEKTGGLHRCVVTHVSKKVPITLLTIHLANGKALTCTHSHPILTNRGWVPALFLTHHDKVLDYNDEITNYTKEMRRMRNAVLPEKLELDNDPSVLGSMQEDKKRTAEESSRDAMRRVRGGSHIVGPHRVGASSERSGVLLGSMQEEVYPGTAGKNDGRNESEVCIGSDESEQPNAQGRIKRENVSNPEKDRAQTHCPGREWAGTNYSTTDDFGGPTFWDGVDSKYWAEERERLSISLQGGCWEQVKDDSGRNRWRFTQIPGKANARPKEGCTSTWIGVDSVQIHKQTSDGRFGGMCPDGYVYNLEVDNCHTYLVDGVVVHNCHHASANSYDAILNYFVCKCVVGFTATAYRESGGRYTEEALVSNTGPFHEIAYQRGISEMIDEGHLVRPRAIRIETHTNLTSTKTQAGDYAPGALDAVINNEARNQLIAEKYVEYAWGKPTIIFGITVDHAQGIAAAINELLNRRMYSAAQCIHGKTPDKDRGLIIDHFKTGRIRVLTTVGVLTEGFDAPATSCIIMARPTKSPILFTQCIGRGLRPSDGKTECLVLDFADVAGRHKLDDIHIGDVMPGAEELRESKGSKPDDPDRLEPMPPPEEIIKEVTAKEVELLDPNRAPSHGLKAFLSKHGQWVEGITHFDANKINRRLRAQGCK